MIEYPQDDQYAQGYTWLGRTVYSQRYYDTPTLKGIELGYYNTDSVVEIFETVVGDPEPKHNPLWYRTERGYIHSSFVQPVKNILNQPVDDIPAGGFIGEVSVPYTQAWTFQRGVLKRAYRFYYASTHWVMRISDDDYGNVWYQVKDDLKDNVYYVSAEHIRRIEPEELAPILPSSDDKRILINLAEQSMSVYDNGRCMMVARTSTGTVEGDTPVGEYRVERKQPSRHMAVYEARGNGFDLPGVPWVCYISWTGVSLHGTYWHNDYGQPRSHGCINLSPEAAKWVYRWTMPHVPVEEDYVESDFGTQVVVV